MIIEVRRKRVLLNQEKGSGDGNKWRGGGSAGSGGGSGCDPERGHEKI